LVENLFKRGLKWIGETTDSVEKTAASMAGNVVGVGETAPLVAVILK